MRTIHTDTLITLDTLFTHDTQKQDCTPVWWASYYGQTDTVKLLGEEFHADVNIPDSEVCDLYCYFVLFSLSSLFSSYFADVYTEWRHSGL